MCREEAAMCHCDALIKAIDRYIAKADGDLADALGKEGYQKPKKTVKYATEIEDEVAEALLDETDYFVENFEKSVDLENFAKKVWPKVKLNDGLRAKLTTVFTEQLSEFMPEFIGYYIKATDKGLTLAQVSKRTTAWVASWSEELAEIMQLNSHTEIEKILTTGLEEGIGMGEFTRRVLESGIRDEQYKARRVAVTEVLRAHSVAQQEAFRQSPAVSEKMWRHTGEYRNQPRQNHVDMDGQRVPIEEPFELIGADGVTYAPMYPRDSSLPPGESINCHCIMQPVVSEEILGLSLEERQKLQQEAVDEMDEEWEKEMNEKYRKLYGPEEE